MAQNWRNTADYRHWRVKVIRRDKKCVICGNIKNRQAHHIECASYNKDLRYNIENGVCLCKTCHRNFHIYYKKGFRKKTNRDDLVRFFKIARFYIKQGVRNGNGRK